MSVTPLLMGEFRPPAVARHLGLSGADAAHGLPAGYGGTCLLNLVEARLERGLSTEVLTLSPDIDEPIRVWASPRLRLWVVRRRPRHVLRDAFRQERKIIQEVIARTAATVCHAHWTYEYALAAVSQDRLPHVITVHDHAGEVRRQSGWRYLSPWAMTHWVYRRGQHFTGVSPYVVEYARRHARGGDVWLIPNLLSARVIEHPSRPDSLAPVLLSAINDAPFKNARRALASFARVRQKRPDARYRLAGPGLEAGGAMALWARERGWEAGVDFLGSLDYEAMMRELDACGVLFHPSLEDSFAMPVAEALARMRPVVAASEAGGPRWLLQEGELGALVSGNDPAAMADALLTALDAPDGKRLEQGRQSIVHLCHADTVLSQFDDVYGEALKHDPGRPPEQPPRQPGR